MIRKSAYQFLMGGALGALLASPWACGDEQPDPLVDNEMFGESASGLTKTQGGNNGASNYCADPANPCLAGEGDCDGNSECDTGLICGINNGSLYGFSGAVDVCVAPHCVDGVRNADEDGEDCGGADCVACDCSGLPPLGLANHCTTECPCPEGEGDCNVDADCDTGLVCGTNNGVQFGFGGGADFCVDPTCTNGVQDAGEVTVDCGGGCGTVCPVDCAATQPVDNGNINRCSDSCPCPPQEGDCDGDLQCQGTAVCVDDTGDEFGFSKSVDMCLAAHCENNVRDGDEGGIDCGPSCIPCPGNATAIEALGGSNLERASDVGVDNFGNVYVIGQYRTTTNLGGGTLNAAVGSSASADEIFVAKYDRNGSHVWSQTFGADASDGDRGLGIGVSGSGIVAITGSFRRSIDFGNGALTTASGADVFIAVFESDGTLRWADSYGISGVEDSGQDVTIDRGGNVIATGFFSSTIDFGGGTLTSTGGRDIFVARFDGNNGNHQNSVRFGGSGNDVGRSVGVDDKRNVYVTGAFRDTVTFGSTTLTGRGSDDIFVLRLGRDSFTPGWAVQYGGPNNDFARGIGVDKKDRLAVGGGFSGTVTFGTVTATSSGNHDIFVVDLNASTGAQRWIRTFGNTGNDEVQGIAVDQSSGDVAAVGYSTGTQTPPGGGTFSGFGGTDAFLIRFDSSGNRIDYYLDGGPGNDAASGVSTANGELAYFGDFEGTIDLVGDSFTSAGSEDLFLVLFQP